MNQTLPLRLAWRIRQGLWLALVGFLVASVTQAQTPQVPPILAGCEDGYPPFCEVNARGEPDGFSVKLLEAVLATMGRQVSYRTGTWSEAKDWLQQGEVQVLPIVGRTPGREAIFDFTVPYMTLHGAIVVRQGTREISAVADLKGREVAVMRGDNAEEYLRREERGITYALTDTFETALGELASGRHEAVVIQRLVAMRLIAQHGWQNLVILPQPIDDFRQEFCFAVKEGDKALLATLNEGLALVMANGTYRHLHTAWFAALELPSRRQLIIGGDLGRPPFQFLGPDGRPTGLMVDLSKAIAREMGLNIEIRLEPWAAVRRNLLSGDLDLAQCMFYSPERDPTFSFSNASVLSHGVAVIRRGSGKPPRSIAQLADLRIVMQESALSLGDSLPATASVQLHRLATQPAMLLEVVNGQADCAIMARESALYWITKNDLNSLEVGTQPLYNAESCYATPKGQQAQLALFEEGFKIVQESGEYRRLYNQWLGAYDSRPSPWLQVLKLLGLGLIPGLAILLLILGWNRTLRRQVAQQTEKLRQSETFLRVVLDNIPVGVAVNDLHRIEYMNDQFARYYGTTREALEPEGAFWEQVYEDPEARQKFKQQVAADCASGDPERMQWYDVPLTRAGQPTRYICARNVMLNPATGMMISTVWDVTDRRLADLDRDRLLLAIEQSTDTILMTDPDGLVIFGNPAFYATTGYTHEEILGHNVSKLRSKDQDPAIFQHIWETIRAGTTWHGQYRHQRKDGSTYTIDGTISPVRDTDGKIISFVTVQRDITKQLSLEAQLRQAQKMESVGRLAGGVAHDFNNMLTVIIGHTDLAMMRLSPNDSAHRQLIEVRKAAQRSADLTRQLLAFARKQTIQPQVMDVNQTIDGLLKMLRRLIGEDIGLRWQPGNKLASILADPTQIDQIMANLCVNARDAIKDHGEVCISTAMATLDQAYCDAHAGSTPGDFVVVAVSDTGCGMSKEVLAHLFEPFFTTKEVGKGTGLGLATVYGIMQQNLGFITVYSEPGKGTTFRLYWPPHAGDSQGGSAPKVTLAAKPGNGETILLVEDDPGILALTEALLFELNYKVISTSSPFQAIALAKQHASAIKLLLTDVVMPEMNGKELAEELQQHVPQLKVLFMSGYTADIVAHHGVLKAGVHFLQKPFVLPTLAAKLHDMLNSPADPTATQIASGSGQQPGYRMIWRAS
jgi:PAS domain S-box-containing protein